MLKKLMSLLDTVPAPTQDTVGAPFARRDLAVAALMLELAQIDRRVRAEESAAVERLVQRRFGLDAATAGRLIAAARVELHAALDDWVFAAAIRQHFAPAERVDVAGLLWEVVYADGRLSRFEEALMRRLSADIGIDAGALETARAQAFARTAPRRDNGGAEDEE